MLKKGDRVKWKSTATRFLTGTVVDPAGMIGIETDHGDGVIYLEPQHLYLVESAQGGGRGEIFAQRVTCPHCKAAPGNPCRSAFGHPVGHHTIRFQTELRDRKD